jgi:hypothetical protein
MRPPRRRSLGVQPPAELDRRDGLDPEVHQVVVQAAELRAAADPAPLAVHGDGEAVHVAGIGVHLDVQVRHPERVHHVVRGQVDLDGLAHRQHQHRVPAALAGADHRRRLPGIAETPTPLERGHVHLHRGLRAGTREVRGVRGKALRHQERRHPGQDQPEGRLQRVPVLPARRRPAPALLAPAHSHRGRHGHHDEPEDHQPDDQLQRENLPENVSERHASPSQQDGWYRPAPDVALSLTPGLVSRHHMAHVIRVVRPARSRRLQGT